MLDTELEAEIEDCLEDFSEYLKDKDKAFQEKFIADFRGGFTKGYKGKAVKVAEKLLSMDMLPEIIMQVTGLDKSDLENLN